MLERRHDARPFHLRPESLQRVQAASARWIAGLLALTAAAWLAALAGLLAIADRVHDDVPVLLAVKLPLLASRPELIFAGESRTVYQVDPALAAQLIGKPQGAAVNIAYDAGEPLALLAAMRREPDRFRKAHVVVSVAPFLFNEGVRSAAVYPQDVAARLGVVEQMVSFLPLRVGTLIRFIREAFAARLAADQHVADTGPQPAAFGVKIIDHTQPDDRWPADIGSHAHYANWDLSGPKARFEIGALCDMVALARKVTVVVPPWAPRYDRARDAEWRDKDDQYVALVTDAGRRCGFDVLNIRVGPRTGAGQLRRRNACQCLRRADLHALSRVAVEALAAPDAVFLLHVPVSVPARGRAGLRRGAPAFAARRHPGAGRRVAVFLRRLAAGLSAAADRLGRGRIFRSACGWRIRFAAAPSALFGVALNLALLCYFKYTNFIFDSINTLTGAPLPFFNIVLPLGISFFTFQQIAYLVDVMRGAKVERDIVSYTLFVSFFPHLIAGPLVHHAEMIPQFKRGRTGRSAVLAARGLAIFAAGLFKKVVIADNLAQFVSPVFAHLDAGGGVTTSMGVACDLGLHLADLFRLLRLFRHGGRARAVVRHPPAGEFPLALQGGLDHRILAALAHHAVALPARLPLHSARRQPARRTAPLSQSDA